jgi:hypothetical protein
MKLSKLSSPAIFASVLGLIVGGSIIHLGNENQIKVAQCLNKGWAPDACSLLIYGR